MPRFVDRQNARFIPLGECQCPETPHPDGDWMKARDKLTYGENLRIIDLAGNGLEQSIPYQLSIKITEWSWVDEKGEPVPITPEIIATLDSEEANRLLSLTNAKPKKAADPKPSGARSRRQ
jgi:hypothetical protein